VRVGGVVDHVHIVTTLPRTLPGAAHRTDKESILEVDPRRSMLRAPLPRPANGERIEVRGIRKRLFRRRANS
jgi:hypothetical protein